MGSIQDELPELDHESTTAALTDSRHLVEIKGSHTKGVGAFATANIPQGTRIIAEEPLTKIERQDSTAKDIIQAFKRLPPSQQRSYLELHGYACESFRDSVEHEMGQVWQNIPQTDRIVLEIHAANSFGEGVFLLGSRINHSCIPNVHFAWNATIQKETFHAIRHITAGEELTIMYINGTNRTRKQRQAELSRWGFQCTCPACETGAAGEAREKKAGTVVRLRSTTRSQCTTWLPCIMDTRIEDGMHHGGYSEIRRLVV